MASWFSSPAKTEQGPASPGSTGSERTQQPPSMKSSKTVSLAEAQLDGVVKKPHLMTRSAMLELENKHNDGASTVMDDEVIGK